MGTKFVGWGTTLRGVVAGAVTGRKTSFCGGETAGDGDCAGVAVTDGDELKPLPKP